MILDGGDKGEQRVSKLRWLRSRPGGPPPLLLRKLRRLSPSLKQKARVLRPEEALIRAR